MQVRLRVQRNPFEDYAIRLTGEGYQDDVVIDQLPDNQVDTVKLVDAPLGVARQVRALGLGGPRRMRRRGGW